MCFRKLYLINATCSLMAGTAIYLFFRSNVLFLSWLSVKIHLLWLYSSGNIIVRYYLPDLLWCYALCFSLFCLHLPSAKKAVFLSLLSFAFGCVWETLQCINFVSGTGDVFDCVAYGVGSFAALCIYFLIQRRKK